MRASEEFFAFRQRVGKLNWKVISSIDMDDLVDKVSVGELQTVLDSLTFCQFTEKETNNQSSKLVTKACQLMQYTIEYLLHCQEMQAQRLDDASAANEELQMKHMKLKMAHIANKEAMRGYRAQLAEFKESARNLGLDGKLFPSTPTTNKMRVVMEPQRPDSSTAVVEKSNSSGGITAESLQRIVESIQQRETESVEQLAAVLRQQRDHFFREMDSGKENVSNSSVREETAAGMGQITALFESYKNQMQQEMARQFAANSSRASVSMDMATQEQKELEARVAAFEAEKTRWEEQREHAERELEEKAQEVKRARASVIPAQQSLSPYRPSRESTRSTTGVATSTSSLFADVSETPSESTAAAGVQQGSPSSPELTVVEVNYHRNALILIKHMLLRYFLRYSSKHSLKSAWAQWKAFRTEAKCASLLLESERTALQHKEAMAIREAELLQQVSSERQKSVIAVARNNSAMAKMRDTYEKQLQSVKLELLRYHQKDEERGRSDAGSILANAQQAAVVSAIHPLVLKAKTEDDLYMQLQERIQENPVISQDYSQIMVDIAAEMGKRLEQYS